MADHELVVLGGQTLTDQGWVVMSIAVAGGTISELIPASPPDLAESSQVLDASGLRVIPGLIDLQVNGGWGLDFASRPESIWEVGEHLVSTGVTAWLPTLVTSGPEMLERAQLALRSRPPGWVGAEPLGWHLEGPWLNPVRKGAHREHLLTEPALPLDEFISRSQGILLVTLAPEVPGCMEAISELVARGIVVSLGHSDADLRTANAGFTAGATMVTHLFNAMSGLHHRTPGVAAAMLSGDVAAGLIVDGIHVVPEMVKLAWQAAGDRIVLVSDTMAGLGMPVGSVKLGSYEVLLDGTSARLADGTLAGSVLDMPTAVRNFVDFTGCDVSEAVAAATIAPAAVVADSTRGRIEPDCRGDFTIVDDAFEVVATVVGGKVVFDRRQ